MKYLCEKDISNISGGIAPWLISTGIGCGLGSISYGYSAYKNSNFSLLGLGYACDVGALSSVATGSLISAAGGGWIGNLTQRPGMLGLGYGVQQANPWK